MGGHIQHKKQTHQAIPGAHQLEKWAFVRAEGIEGVGQAFSVAKSLDREERNKQRPSTSYTHPIHSSIPSPIHLSMHPSIYQLQTMPSRVDKMPNRVDKMPNTREENAKQSGEKCHTEWKKCSTEWTKGQTEWKRMPHRVKTIPPRVNQMPNKSAQNAKQREQSATPSEQKAKTQQWNKTPQTEWQNANQIETKMPKFRLGGKNARQEWKAKNDSYGVGRGTRKKMPFFLPLKSRKKNVPKHLLIPSKIRPWPFQFCTEQKPKFDSNSKSVFFFCSPRWGCSSPYGLRG